jgi:hypothetical protein
MQRAPALAAFSKPVFPKIAGFDTPRKLRKAPAAGKNNAMKMIMATLEALSAGRDLVIAPCAT